MSIRRAEHPTAPRSPARVSPGESAGAAGHIPLKPRRVLMIALGGVLVLLLAGLILLYVYTIYPNRNKPQAIELDSPEVPAKAVNPAPR